MGGGNLRNVGFNQMLSKAAILSFRHSKAFRDLKNISKGVLGAILHVLLCLKAGRLVK
jgi:hypothetical protein